MANAVEKKKPALPVMSMADDSAFADWLAAHPDAPGIWIRFPKKGATWRGIDKHRALDVALCYGWIDGQAAKGDEDSYLMRFTPRRPKSMWSQVNCARAEELIFQGRMRAEGLAQVMEAKADGRWDAAYPSPSSIAIPAEVSAAFDVHPAAAARFNSLPKTQRYQLLLAIVTKKKPETRVRKALTLVTSLMANVALEG